MSAPPWPRMPLRVALYRPAVQSDGSLDVPDSPHAGSVPSTIQEDERLVHTPEGEAYRVTVQALVPKDTDVQRRDVLEHDGERYEVLDVASIRKLSGEVQFLRLNLSGR